MKGKLPRDSGSDSGKHTPRVHKARQRALTSKQLHSRAGGVDTHCRDRAQVKSAADTAKREEADIRRTGAVLLTSKGAQTSTAQVGWNAGAEGAPRGMWFLLLLDDGLQKERIFLSARLDGPYTEHPASQRQLVRHAGVTAGRLLTDDYGVLYAFHQSSGVRVEAVQVLNLSPTQFEYGVGFELLQPREELPWATEGMHSFNAQRLHDGSWVVVVDGWWLDEHLQRYQCLDAGEKDCPT
jgi:hypothetical protein